MRHPRTVDELTAQQQFGDEHSEIGAGERGERSAGVHAGHHNGTGDSPTRYQPGSRFFPVDRSIRFCMPSESAFAVIISRNRCETLPKSKKSRCHDHWKLPPYRNQLPPIPCTA